MTATLAETIKSLGPERAARYTAAMSRSAARLVDVDVTKTAAGYSTLEGRAVPYDTWADVGWYLEEHRYGSLHYTTAANRNLPLHLWHDSRSWPIGHSVNWRHQGDGLYGTWELNDRPEAQEAARLARSGELGYLSIGFSPIRSQWDMAEVWDPDLGPEYMDKVTRLESRLLEVSIVSTPAFADATVTNVRSDPYAKRLLA